MQASPIAIVIDRFRKGCSGEKANIVGMACGDLEGFGYRGLSDEVFFSDQSSLSDCEMCGVDVITYDIWKYNGSMGVCVLCM